MVDQEIIYNHFLDREIVYSVSENISLSLNSGFFSITLSVLFCFIADFRNRHMSLIQESKI